MPYLFFYLLYYWRKWPVNPGSGGHIPSLLHVYWALHAIHVILGLLALRTWRQDATLNPALSPSNGSQRSALSSQLSTPSRPPSDLWPLISGLLPWALLALIFYIPGVYLEFPSDPWEHLRRINDCLNHQTLTLYKFSGYFLAFSFLGRIPADRQLLWLNIYYTGICLLLCWQYYRLALAVSLGERASLVFVILQTVLFGNTVFSFYRYYGISSSIYAQLGAVALIRLGIDFAQQPSTRPTCWLKTLGIAALLALLTAFNHVQGLGIAALGLAAVAVWRSLKWKRSMLWWLALAALILSVATLHWWPHHRSLDRIYRPSGWLTSWDGFNLFSPSSPAEDRALQILGFLGVINLAAGLLLLMRRNHVVGWLTVMPLLALSLPFVAIPLTGVLTQYDRSSTIITFHRMLFAIPSGLALICLGKEILYMRTKSVCISNLLSSLYRHASFGITVLTILAFTTTPASGPYYNKAWHTLMKTSDDLAMRGIWTDFNEYTQSPLYRPNELLAATSGISIVINSQKFSPLICGGPTYYYSPGCSPSADFKIIKTVLDNPETRSQTTLVIPSLNMLYTPYSFAALCAHHWLPQEVALAFSGARELHALGSSFGLHPANPIGQITYYTPASK
jgi:hypothetical protein